MNVVVFRFPNMVGNNLTHGVIHDFIKKLKRNPYELKVLGDGTQRKPYMHVDDLIKAIMKIMESGTDGVEIYNVGVDTDTSVTEIADFVCQALNLKNVRYLYTGGSEGWMSDVPYYKFDLTKIHSTGWKAVYTSNEAILKTLGIFSRNSASIRERA